MKARAALAALLFAAPALASAAQVGPPPKSAVWAERDGWSFAVRDPETTTDAFQAYVSRAPSVDALIAGLKHVYDDRMVSVDASAHLVSISDEHRMWPIPARGYAAFIPNFEELADVPDAPEKTKALAEQPVGNVHAVPLANGTPHLVCDVEGAVSLTYWQATNVSVRPPHLPLFETACFDSRLSGDGGKRDGQGIDVGTSSGGLAGERIVGGGVLPSAWVGVCTVDVLAATIGAAGVRGGAGGVSGVCVKADHRGATIGLDAEREIAERSGGSGRWCGDR